MNVTLPASGVVVATETIEGAEVQVVKVANLPATQPVSAVALPLPTGAATEATLAALKAAADAIQAAAEALNTKTTAVNTGAIAGTVGVSNFPATQAVSGIVAVSNLPATQPVSGTVTVANPTAQGLTDAQLRAAAVPVSVGNFPATQPVSAAALPLPAGAATEATAEAARTLLATLISALGNHSDPAADGRPGMVAFAARRRDSDATPTIADGDLAFLSTDEEGRVKVSSKPASYPDITGDITAIQAAIGTPVVGGTVSGDVSRASNVMAFCTGTFAGVNVTFEGSLELAGETNWFGLQAVRSNANTIETATGVLAAQPVYGWELSVNALKRVRVRCTARTSGTQSWRFVQGTYATEPIPAAQVSATQPVSGTVTATVTPPAPTTPYFVNSAATTNGALVIAGTSGVQFFWATNEGASPAYVKLYNKATAPTVGTDVPEMIIPVAAAVGGVPGVSNPDMGVFIGARFALGLGIAITRNAVHTDTTAVGAGEVKVKLSRTT